MAADVSPVNYIYNFSGNSTTCSIPSTSLAPESSSNVHNDIRRFMHGLLTQVYNHYNTLPTTSPTAATKPTNMQINKFVSVNTLTSQAVETFTFNFTNDLSLAAMTVAAE